MKRARKPKPPPSMKPWPCVILAVDTATNSGWSVWIAGSLFSSGAVNIDDGLEIAHTCRGTLEFAEHCVLVLERPFGGSNSGTLMALGAAHHAWRNAWKLAGGSERRIVRVYPATWRARVLGQTTATAPLERAYAIRCMREHRSRSMDSELSIDVGPDEAAAICIGKWASHAGEVGAVLPAKIRKAVA